MEKVVVVIPVYKEKLKPSERVSLNQAKKILGKYDICFMAPERMRGFLSSRGYMAEYFPDEYFGSVKDYSHLLMRPEFYHRFEKYENLLIYQLDVFVFSDRLLEFCNMGYDYIGAPMPYWSSWSNMHTRVGNGGFSLRKVDSCIRVLNMKKEIYERTGREYEFETSEDKFFGFCGSSEDIDFSIPDTDTASDFSIEFDIKGCWQKLSMEHLPFGCHAWSKPCYFGLWRPYIESFAGDISDVMSEVEKIRQNALTYAEMRRMNLDQYLLKRLYRRDEHLGKIHLFYNALPANREIFLWGNGRVGQKTKKLLSYIGYSIFGIIDKAIVSQDMDGSIPVMLPNDDVLNGNNFIIISVTKESYVNEIAECLLRAGLKQGRDFISYSELSRIVVDRYYSEARKRWRKHTE